GGIRAPLFVRWPGVFQPRTVDRIAAHIDVMPTLLGVTGVAKPSAVKFDGVSLSPLLRGEGSDWPDRTLFFQVHRGDTPEQHRAFAARSQRYKVIQPLGNGENKLPPAFGFELYDMANDPLQQRNVAAEQPEIVTGMTNQYEAWFKDVTGGRDYADRGVARVVIGSSRENPVRLTRQDWRGPQAAWTATSLGYWEVDVRRAGVYDVTMRFAELTRPGTISFAHGGNTLQKEVPAGAVSAIFNRVRLTRGAGRLESWVTQDDRRIGMLDVIVTHLR
ncbi:MAG: sulfatase-like hydrolase/transferase, partial [Acidobacteriota bacterium]|nr:sulfatase-like hydrolase/transferase [Acidobacteriota bacterium]